MPMTWEDCKDDKELAALLAGDDAKDAAREVTTRETMLKVLVCGTDESNKSMWLANLLGLVCARRPERNVLHGRFCADRKPFAVEFAVTDQVFASAEYMDRWADAYVLVYDVGSRESFEAVKDFYRGITEERLTVFVPVVLVANHTEAQTEDTWKIPRAEADTLSETLSIPLCVCATPADAHKSMLELARVKSKKEEQRQEGPADPKKASQVRSGTELEMVLLGDAFVGKTTFMGKMFDRRFEPSYASTTGKVIRKDNVLVNSATNEACTLKIVDTPWFAPAAQEVKTVAASMDGSGGAGGSGPSSVAAASAMAAVDWLKQQQLLQAQCFVVLFSVTDRDSYMLATSLVAQLKVALADAPKSANKVIFLIGTKTDQVYATVISSLDLFNAAKKLGVLSTTMSLKNDGNDVMQTVMQRVLTGLRYQGKWQPIQGEFDKQGYVVPGVERKKGKQKLFYSIKNSVLSVGHSEKDTGSEGRYPITESSTVEAIKDLLHFITLDQHLWFSASNDAERGAWFDCLRFNIAAVQATYHVIESFVHTEVRRALHELLPTAKSEEFAAIDKLLAQTNYRAEGQSFIVAAPIETCAKEDPKQAKKKEKDKRKAEKEREKEREKAEKEREKAEKKLKK